MSSRFDRSFQVRRRTSAIAGLAALAGVALAGAGARAEPTDHADDKVLRTKPRVNKRWYLGVGIPFQGFGFYERPDNAVTVWNLTPLSIEGQVSGHLGARFSVYTVYSLPQPARLGELEFNLELPYYFFFRTPGMSLSGGYLGPMVMLQLHDQDTGASLGGPGVTLGYRGAFSDSIWYRMGVYTAYHHYLFGPRQALLDLTGGSESGGVFMGLTLFEVGAAL